MAKSKKSDNPLDSNKKEKGNFVTLGECKPKGVKKTDPKYKKWIEGVREAQMTASLLTTKYDDTLATLKDQDQVFQECCTLTQTDPTRRQYSKWKNERGRARTQLRGVLNQIVGDAALALDKAKEDGDKDAIKKAMQAVELAESKHARLIKNAR